MTEADTFDYKKAAQYLKEKERKKSVYRSELHQKALEDFRQIVDMIKSDFSPKRIYQWGSLLDKKQFDENSDIDIAVEGLDSTEKFFKLHEKASKMTSFSLDLVEIEKISSLHQESIRQNGKLVYER